MSIPPKFSILSALFLLPFALVVAQKDNLSTTSQPPSQLIAKGAPPAELKPAWEQTVRSQNPKSYNEAKELVDYTVQMALLQGNRYLAGAIMQFSYLQTLRNTLIQEINQVNTALHTKQSLPEKRFKLQADSKDLQRLSAFTSIKTQELKEHRATLVTTAYNTLQSDNGQSSTKGKNPPATLYAPTDVIAGQGQNLVGDASLQTYKSLLERQLANVQTSTLNHRTLLQNTLVLQQNIAQNIDSTAKTLLEQALEIINKR